jgi:hypothetical protein
MTVSTGLRGNSGAYLTMKIGAATATDFSGDLKQIRLTSEDKDDSDLTFEEAASGDTKAYTLALTGIQSTATGSLWKYLWDNPGAEITVVYGPHGNAAPSVTQPHFSMTVKASGKPEIGGEAKRSKERFSFDYECEVLTGPTLVTV